MANQPVSNERVNFFLYFPSESLADAAAITFRSLGFVTPVEPGIEADEWSLIASRGRADAGIDTLALASQVEAITFAHDGEYDLWGIDSPRSVTMAAFQGAAPRRRPLRFPLLHRVTVVVGTAALTSYVVAERFLGTDSANRVLLIGLATLSLMLIMWTIGRR